MALEVETGTGGTQTMGLDTVQVITDGDTSSDITPASSQDLDKCSSVHVHFRLTSGTKHGFIVFEQSHNDSDFFPLPLAAEEIQAGLVVGEVEHDAPDSPHRIEVTSPAQQVDIVVAIPTRKFMQRFRVRWQADTGGEAADANAWVYGRFL